MGLGDFVSGIFGSKNDFHARERAVDPNAYQYGGQQGGADEAAGRYRGYADSAQSRQGAQADYSQANWDRTAAGQARQGQADVANMMAARAMGQVPSVAGMQANEQMRQLGQQAQQQGQQAVAAQGAQQASARGAAGVAMAGQNAANNIANAQGAIGTSAAQAAQGISGQAQVNAAAERAQAEQGALGAFGAIRGGDQTSGQMAAQNAQFNASLHQQQRAQNDQMTLGMTQNEMGVRNSQLTGGMNHQAQISANSNFAQGQNAQVAAQNAGTNQENSMGIIKAAAGVAGGAAMSDERAKRNVHDLGLSPADVVTSTWGVGRGVQPSDIQDRALAERRSREADQGAMARQPMAGGFAVPGLSPGVRDPNDRSRYMTGAQPLIQRDQEMVSLSKAKQAEGMDLSEDEARRAGGARSRLSNEKKDEKLTAAEGAGGALKDFASSPTARPSYHAGPAYVPPQLLPINSGMEMKTAIQPMARADGGPVAQGKPYLVGERGPEVIVPKQAGTVVPNEQVRDFGEVEDWDLPSQRVELGQDEGYRHRTMQAEMDRVLAEKQNEKSDMKRSERAEKSFRGSAAERRDAENQAARDADLYIASMKRSLARGASVARDEGELDNEPARGPADWLVAHMGSLQKQPEPQAMMVSDDRAKLAAAWDEGHAAAASDLTKLSGRSPAELKKLGESNSLARALTQVKASAWTEGATAAAPKRPAVTVRSSNDDHPAIGLGPVSSKGREMTKADFEEADRRARNEAAAAAPPAPMGSTMGSREVERGRSIDAGVFPELMAQARPERSLSELMYSDERTKDVQPLANAARAMKGSAYEYKPEFTPPEQRPGEKNVGPMAQNMARDPVAANIVKKGENGYLMLDTAKMVKTLGAIAADQQRQQDEQDKEIATLASRMRRRK